MTARSSSGSLAHARSFELFQPPRGWDIARERRRPAELVDKKDRGCAVLVKGQVEIAQAKMRFRLQTLYRCRGEVR